MAGFTTIVPWVTGDVITASRFNGQYGDNLNFLNGSHGVQHTRGMMMRRNPTDFSKVILTKADEIVMDDGERHLNWSLLSLSNGVSGAGGLDTGSVVDSTWYEIYAIAKNDGTRNLLLHKADTFGSLASQATKNADSALRDASARTALAQGFQSSSALPVVGANLTLTRVGSPTGQVWVEIRTDNAGNPSSTVLATSEVIEASRLSTTATVIRFIFRTPATLATSTQYHLVVLGTYSISGSNYVNVGGDTANSYANGVAKAYDGATWGTGDVGGSILDFYFSVIPFTSGGAVVMPSGYTKKALIGFVFYVTASSFAEMIAMDRDVSTEYDAIVAGGTSTTPVQIAGLPLPAIPVMLRTALIASVADTDVFLGGAPQGYSDTNYAARVYATNPTSGTIVEFGLLPVEQRTVYYNRRAGTGAVTIYVRGYRW